MSNVCPNHFSYSFKLPLSKIPTKKVDRLPYTILLMGIFFGVLLALLGIYDLWSEKNNLDYQSVLNINIFDIALILIGSGIIINLINSYFHYKKIYYDGKKISVVSRNNLKKLESFKEPIKNYEGVRFRIEFFMCGFINRNRYIIELYHKNPQKIVPLYISTSNNNIRKYWEDYAKAFNLPTIIETDEGTVIRQISDFGKSVKEMANTWNIKEKLQGEAFLSVEEIIEKAKKEIEEKDDEEYPGIPGIPEFPEER